MQLHDQFRLHARYNAWMNENLLAAMARLPPERLLEARGAFFGSVIGTLNHILVADLIWLKRFARHAPRWTALAPLAGFPDPEALDQILYADPAGFGERRRRLDGIIARFVEELAAADLDTTVSYRSLAGRHGAKPLAALLTHFFNHQTHHRGQASTLLFQLGVDIGVTDLVVLVDDIEA